MPISNVPNSLTRRRAIGRVCSLRGVLIVAALLAYVAASRVCATAEEGRLAPNQYTSGSLVRNAFRSVVAKPNRATVQLLADDQPVAYGVVVESNGLVLSKASELRGELQCLLEDNRKVAASIVGIAVEHDLAMLKIEADKLPVIQWKKGAAPSVGSWLATTGLSDAPVAVGVASVPQREIPQQHGVLGVRVSEGQTGPLVSEVVPNSGAAKAGVLEGDVITHFAGTVVRDQQQLSSKIHQYCPGDRCRMHVLRQGNVHEMQVTLTRPLKSIFNRRAFQNNLGGELSNRRSGFPAVLQHDTVLTPSQCGGPLVDLTGKAVGINIARAGRTETHALPAATILSLIPDLKSGKLAPAAPRAPAPPRATKLEQGDE